jgi:2-methylcitrate dehydratase PrpD
VSRITAHVDPEIERMGAAFRHAARVRVITRDARAFEKMPLDRRGSPENAMTREEIEDKFRHVVAPCVDKARAERIIEAVRSLERLENTKELVELVAAPVG